MRRPSRMRRPWFGGPQRATATTDCRPAVDGRRTTGDARRATHASPLHDDAAKPKHSGPIMIVAAGQTGQSTTTEDVPMLLVRNDADTTVQTTNRITATVAERPAATDKRLINCETVDV